MSRKIPTTTEIVRDWRDRLGSIPSTTNDFVCKFCLGPVTGWSQCFGCKKLFIDNGVPNNLRRITVPMTSALNPSPWYSTLLKYKEFERLNGAVLPSVAHMFLRRHSGAITRMLGGPCDVYTIVPSKRRPFEQQPLAGLMAKLEPALGSPVRQTLTHVEGAACPRHEYRPDIFASGPQSVRGKRVVLIEDTWITGATAISAAGRLMELGASSVVLLPVARAIDSNWWDNDHPYLAAMRQPLPDASLAIDWPR